MRPYAAPVPLNVFEPLQLHLACPVDLADQLHGAACRRGAVSRETRLQKGSGMLFQSGISWMHRVCQHSYSQGEEEEAQLANSLHLPTVGGGYQKQSVEAGFSQGPSMDKLTAHPSTPSENPLLDSLMLVSTLLCKVNPKQRFFKVHKLASPFQPWKTVISFAGTLLIPTTFVFSPQSFFLVMISVQTKNKYATLWNRVPRRGELCAAARV